MELSRWAEAIVELQSQMKLKVLIGGKGVVGIGSKMFMANHGDSSKSICIPMCTFGRGK